MEGVGTEITYLKIFIILIQTKAECLKQPRSHHVNLTARWQRGVQRVVAYCSLCMYAMTLQNASSRFGKILQRK